MADERAQARQGIGRARELGVELATPAFPRRAQAVALLEAGEIGLAAESHRELLVAAGDADDRPRGNRRAIVEANGERGAVRAPHRKVEQQSAPEERHRFDLQLVDLRVEGKVALLDRHAIDIVCAHLRQYGVAVRVGPTDGLVVLEDSDAGIVGHAHDPEAVGNLAACGGVTADVADPARDAHASGSRPLESRDVRFIRSNVVLPDAARLDLIVGMRNDAVAIAFASRQIALQGEAGVVAVTLAALAHAVVADGGERSFTEGNRDRRAQRNAAVRAEGLRRGQAQESPRPEADGIAHGQHVDVVLGTEILRHVGDARAAVAVELVPDRGAPLSQRDGIIRRGANLAKRGARPLPLRNDAQVSRLALKADAAERSCSRAASATRDRGRSDDTDVGNEIARGDTGDAEFARGLAPDLAGQQVGQAPAVGRTRDRVTIIAAFDAEIVALESSLVGEVFQAGLEQ